MEDEDVAHRVAELLGDRTIATAESCTAGRVAEVLACVEHVFGVNRPDRRDQAVWNSIDSTIRSASLLTDSSASSVANTTIARTQGDSLARRPRTRAFGGCRRRASINRGREDRWSCC